MSRAASEGEGSAGLPETGGQLLRFDVAERLVHWTTALLMLVCLASGTILYVPSLMLRVGNRATLVNIHVVAGLGLIVPVLAGLAGPWRGRLAADLRRLDRWQKPDFDFFLRRSPAGRAGKFNGGQKLASAVFAGGGLVTVLTGVVMRWSPPFPNRWAAGATLVHDTIYVVLLLLVAGHVAIASSRPVQMRSMVTGRVPLAWARRHAPAWVDESDLPSGSDGVSPRRVGPRASPPPQQSARRGPEAAVGTSRASD